MPGNAWKWPASFPEVRGKTTEVSGKIVLFYQKQERRGKKGSSMRKQGRGKKLIKAKAGRFLRGGRN